MVAQFMRESMAPLLIERGHQVQVLGFEPMLDRETPVDAIIIDRLKHSELRQLRERFPRTLLVLCDPKMSNGSFRVVDNVDLSLVGSIELEVLLARRGLPTTRIYWVPDLDGIEVLPWSDRNDIVSYHGNSVHLRTFARMGAAEVLHGNPLDSSAETILEAHYSHKKSVLGGLPSPLRSRVAEFQFRGVETWRAMSRSRLGLIPNLLPPTRSASKFYRSLLNTRFARRSYLNPYLRRPDDIRLEFKPHTNAARLYPFAFFQIPVIADLSPSVATFVRHGETGWLAWNCDSWKFSIESVRSDRGRLREFGEALHQSVVPEMHPRKSVDRLEFELLGRLALHDKGRPQ